MRATTPVRPSYTARPGEAILVFRDDDGSFAIGVGRITIAPDDILFVNDVVADFGPLAHSAEGEEVLRRGDAIGHKVRIDKPDPPTEPPNGWIVPDDLAAARLLLLLRQANLNAAGKSNPAIPDWGDTA